MRLLLAISVALALFALPLLAAPEAARQDNTPSAAATRNDVERAARDFRIAVYNTFRRDRAEFERRNSAWQQLYARWKTDGAKPAELSALLAWLDSATRASQSNAVRALPQSPQFGLTAQLPQRGSSPTAPTVAPTVEPTIPPLERKPVAAVPPPRATDSSPLPSVPLTISPDIARPQRPSIIAAADAATTADVRPDRPAPPAVVDSPPIPILVPNDTAELVPPVIVDGIDVDGVDVDEVAVRVAGHNLSLATLVEEFRKLDRPTIEQLAAAVERLEAHAVRAGDLSPYYALVGESDRNRLRPLSSIAEARRLLDDRISHEIAVVTADATLPSFTRAENLARLSELHRRTAQLSPETFSTP